LSENEQTEAFHSLARILLNPLQNKSLVNHNRLCRCVARTFPKADARTDGGVLPDRFSALFSVQDEGTNPLVRCESDSSRPRATISGSASGVEVADQDAQVGLLALIASSFYGSKMALIPRALN